MFSGLSRSIVVVAACLAVVGCSSTTQTQHAKSNFAVRDVVSHKYAFKRGEIWYGEKMSPSRVGAVYQACINQGQKVANSANNQTVYVANAGLVGALALGIAQGAARGIAHKKGAETLTSCLSNYGFVPKKISEHQVDELKNLGPFEQKQKLEELMSGMSDAEFAKSLDTIATLDTHSGTCKPKHDPTDASVSILKRNRCL